MSTHMRKKGAVAPPFGSSFTSRAHPRSIAAVSPPRRKVLGLGRGTLVAAAIGVLAVAVLGAIFVLSNVGGSSASGGAGGKYPYKVGQPRPGAQAPQIDLPSTAGGTFDLASLRGQTVLLFFEEGLTCQPCWDQIKDIETHGDQFQALGIDKFVAITSDPLPELKQKVADDHLTTPVLSDTDLRVSGLYNADKYTMMPAMMGMGARDGHTFVLINKDGVITWRADYGGAPNYTMYLPAPNLLAAIQQGTQGASR